MADNWFQSTTWNDTTERQFNEKLQRAKKKDQYLRIQASTLARSHPEVALQLLDRYFSLDTSPKGNFDRALAHVDRATALLTLGRTNDAVDAYSAALARESEFPNVITQARLDLPFLIATHGIREKFTLALELLERYKESLMFPLEHFRWHTARALIALGTQDVIAAKAHAQRALEAAALDHSGFRYHPHLGLVTNEYEEMILKLQKLSSSATPK